LALGAAASFAMGLINAPERGGRLPGERARGQAAVAASAIDAPDATPLSQDRIEAPPKPAPKAVNTDQGDEADTADDAADATAPAKTAETAKPAPATAAPAPPPETAAPPPDDEPPH
jgi:hypothetical protein